MMSAFVFGTIGIASSYWLGSFYFRLTPSVIFLSILVSNVAGFVALLSTLTLERQDWARRYYMNRSITTWSVLSGFYFAILFICIPELRSFHVIGGMFLPLLFSTGFMIPLFGVAQDRIIGRAQRKAQEKARAQQRDTLQHSV